MDCLTVPQIWPNSPRKKRGQIQVIFGPMFSGKSTELMRRVRRFQIAQYSCLVIKYAKDNRCSDKGVARQDKYTMEVMSASRLHDLHSLALQACVIGVDEGQFFPDTVEFCEEMANMGKTIIVAALDGTYQRKPYGNILNLVPLAESVVKLSAVCSQCFGEAAYTKLGKEREVEVIGGADMYHAVCRTCYSALTSGKENSTPEREEAPPHALLGSRLPSGVSRVLFATLQT